MSTMFAGYIAPSQEEALMVLQVLCLTGEGLTFKIPGSTLGRDVHKIVSEQLPCKPGARLSMHLGSTRLMLHVPIQDQCTGPATLSCTYVLTNLYPRLYWVGDFYSTKLAKIHQLSGASNGTCFFLNEALGTSGHWNFKSKVCSLLFLAGGGKSWGPICHGWRHRAPRRTVWGIFAPPAKNTSKDRFPWSI